MPINQLSLTNSILNISTPSSPGLTLNKGEVVKGLVQDVKPDGLLSLLIQGQMVEAFSEVPVEKGRQIQLLVDDFREGRTYLKVVNEETLNNMAENRLSSTLQSMGVPSDRETLSMAKKLLQYNLPVNRDNLNELGRSVKLLGGFSPRNAEIAAFGLAGGVSAQPEVLEALTQYFNSETDLTRLVKDLVQIINTPAAASEESPVVSPDAGTGTEAAKMPVDAAENQTASQNAKPNASSTPGYLSPPESGPGLQAGQPTGAGEPKPPGDTPAFQVQSEPKPQSFDPEIIRVPIQSDTASSTSPGSGIISTTGNEDLKRQAAGLLRDLLQVLTIDSRDAGSDTAMKLQSRPQETRDLVKGLVWLRDILKTADGGGEQVHELLKRVEGLEKEISGQQAANYVGKNVGGQEQQGGIYYLSFPAQAEGDYQQVQLRVQRDSSRRDLASARQLSLVVALDTQNLGRVLFHVDWSQTKKIGLQGVVENDQVCQYLNSKVSTLLQKLTDMGYVVDNHGIKVSENHEIEEQLKWKIDEQSDRLPFCRVDITV